MTPKNLHIGNFEIDWNIFNPLLSPLILLKPNIYSKMSSVERPNIARVFPLEHSFKTNKMLVIILNCLLIFFALMYIHSHEKMEHRIFSLAFLEDHWMGTPHKYVNNHLI